VASFVPSRSLLDKHHRRKSCDRLRHPGDAKDRIAGTGPIAIVPTGKTRVSSPRLTNATNPTGRPSATCASRFVLILANLSALKGILIWLLFSSDERPALISTLQRLFFREQDDIPPPGFLG
jgi:hypothetical protein